MNVDLGFCLMNIVANQLVATDMHVNVLRKYRRYHEKCLFFQKKDARRVQLDSYLGHTKSSERDTLFSYRRLEEIFFLYSLIEKRLVYFSMLFDHS